MLYVPGSGGSYKQARNVGTVLYQKMKMDATFPFHFNMFTINYNEELSAFYGGTIQQQTDFLAESVKVRVSQESLLHWFFHTCFNSLPKKRIIEKVLKSIFRQFCRYIQKIEN